MEDELNVIVKQVIEDNKETIENFLENETVIFDDELINCPHTRLVLRKLSQAICEEYNIEDTVQRLEDKVNGEYRGIFFKVTDNMSIEFIKGMLETRYR